MKKILLITGYFFHVNYWISGFYLYMCAAENCWHFQPDKAQLFILVLSYLLNSKILCNDDYSAKCELRLHSSPCFPFFQQSGSELVYTNTLQNVRPYTKVSRLPSLILPLACRIPGVQAKGPLYNVSMPKEVEIFGVVRYWIEIYLPGQGPVTQSTRSLRLLPQRMRRGAGLPSKINTTSTSSINSTSTSSINRTSTSSPSTTSSTLATTSYAIGSKINQLDIYVLSNCSIVGAQMIVSNCITSNTSDFAETMPFLNQGLVAIDLFHVIVWGYHLGEDRYCMK